MRPRRCRPARRAKKCTPALFSSTVLLIAVARREAFAQQLIEDSYGGSTTVIAPIRVPPMHGAPGALAAAPEDPEAITRRRSAVRFRFGIGGYVGGAFTRSSGGGGPGIALDLGLQAGDTLAVYARLRAASLLLVNAASISAIVEWTPVEFFSVGAGLGADAMATVGILTSGTSDGGLSIPLLVGFNIGGRAPTQVHRSKFRIGLEGAVLPGLGGHAGGSAGLVLAWALM